MQKSCKTFVDGYMRLIDIVVKISKFAPELQLKSALASKVKVLFSNVSEQRYSSASLFVALAASLLFFVFTLSIPVFLFSFAAIFYFLLSLPSIELKNEAMAVDTELPFYLREIGILLGMGVPFNSTISIAAKAKGKLSEKIGAAVSEMDAGASFQKAISAIAISSHSQHFKRAASVLISAYEHGSGEGLIPLSDEMLFMQRHQLKEASSKLAIFGLLFIVFSAVAPTFLLIYFHFGQIMLSTEIPESVFLMAMLVALPLASLLILLVAKSSLPLFQEQSGFELNLLSFYKSQKRKEEIEHFLPDALLSISTVPAGSSAEAAFVAVAKGGYGQLSKEFEISLKQLRSKVSLEKILLDLSKRNNSPMLSRAASLLSHVFSTNKFYAAARLAEDFLADFELRRERANLFSIQKYTLFFGALLLPMILSIAISLSSEMADFLGVGINIQFISLVVQLYMLIYCAMVSYFAAFIENKKSLFVVYLPLLFALSLITFYAVGFIRG